MEQQLLDGQDIITIFFFILMVVFIIKYRSEYNHSKFWKNKYLKEVLKRQNK